MDKKVVERRGKDSRAGYNVLMLCVFVRQQGRKRRLREAVEGEAETQ